MTKYIGIGFVTGRKHFKNVLKTYINNWLEYGINPDKNIQVHLFIAYDLKYQNTEIDDYKNIDPLLKELVASVTFIGENKIKDEMKFLVDADKISEEEAELIFGDGYAKKRNAVLYFAQKQKMDKLIFLDDDEYPMAVFKEDNNFLSWRGQSIVGTHLKYNDAADITHGYHCGYISPIPAVQFNDKLDEKSFKLFIETISNDIISWQNVKQNILENNGVTYAKKAILEQKEADEVVEEKGMKFISGANLCFNLKKGNKLPPFYNPPGARGEDTFMSTCLSNLTVVKVPCYAFHDGFSTHNSLLNGVLPVRFISADTDSVGVVTRFVKAAIGWVRYKPLLLFITQRDKYADMIEKMIENLKITLPKMSAYFGTEKFNQLITELNYYHRNVEKHYYSFQKTKEAWQKVLL